MTIHFLDVSCSDCGAAAGQPCRRSMGPHYARRQARDAARDGAARVIEDDLEARISADEDEAWRKAKAAKGAK
jgi:hypothetical protein